MQSIAAGLSGGTLGYIWNNLPGAYRGYQFGRRMAPMYRKRKQSSFRTNNKKRKYTKTPSRRSTGGLSVLTNQYDYKTQYVKKRMPSRKRKTWVKFVKKVAAASRADLGLKTVVFNNSITQATGGLGSQAAYGVHLYGIRGNSPGINKQIGANDVLRLFANDPSIEQGTGPQNPRIGKLLFQSAVMDVTLRNIGTVTSEVDIYCCIHRKDVISGSVIVDDFEGSALELPINGGVPNTTLDISLRGVTLFDLPTGLSQSGITVLTKKKIILQPGNTSLIQHRDPKNHVIDMNRIRQCGYGARKLTYTVIFVHKPIVGSSPEDVSDLAIGITRKYSYYEQANNKDMSALNPS